MCVSLGLRCGVSYPESVALHDKIPSGGETFTDKPARDAPTPVLSELLDDAECVVHCDRRP